MDKPPFYCPWCPMVEGTLTLYWLLMSDKTSSKLSDLHDLFREDLEITNRFILQHLNSQVEMIPTLGNHLINSGGKRLRPLLTLIAARHFGYRGEHHALLAAVIEFIHTATLLHDDVVDTSSTRRGKATANAVWGSKAPILVGDFLFSRAFQLLVDHGNLRILAIIADACAIISEGEVMQLMVSKDLATSEAIYLEVVSRKTATLFSAAAHVGAVLGGCSEEAGRGLARYGLLLGTAFQLVDDALDYAADQAVLGKTVGDDFQDGKITLPVIHAYSHGSEEEQAFWRQTMEQGNPGPDQLQRAISLVTDRGSVAYAMQHARSYVGQAVAAIQEIPDSEAKMCLLRLAEFAVERTY